MFAYVSLFVWGNKMFEGRAWLTFREDGCLITRLPLTTAYNLHLSGSTTAIHPPNNGNILPRIITEQIPIPERNRRPRKLHDSGNLPDTTHYNGDFPACLNLLSVSH